MQDLLKEPLWQEDSLGQPIPDSPHACAVSLPTWDSVVGYEEGREKIIAKMKTGYPRFFLHAFIKRLFVKATEEIAGPGQKVILFAGKGPVQRAQRYVERFAKVATRITSYQRGLQALVVPEEAERTALEYWQHTGEIISSRQAEDLLADKNGESFGLSSSLLRQKVAETSGAPADHHYFLESGMAAIFTAHRVVTGIHPGKKTLQLEFPYVDGLKVQEKFGSGVAFLYQAEGEDFDEAIRRIQEGEFAAVFCEAPSNPLLRTADLVRLAEACRVGEVPLVIDDTVASAINVDVLKVADLVTTSLTKWASGKGDVCAGMVTINPKSRWVEEFRAFLTEETEGGSRLYSGEMRVLWENIEGFEERVRRSNVNAAMVADYLREHPAVEKVWYPSLVTREHYETIRRPDGGYGGLLSFSLKQAKKMPKVYDALRFCKGPSLGTEFTLASPYTMLAHYHELDWAAACGVPAELLRLSVGGEDGDVLLATLGAALEQV